VDGAIDSAPSPAAVDAGDAATDGGQLSANEAGGNQSDSATDAIVNEASPVDASVDATMQDGALGDTGVDASVGDGPAAEDSGIVPGDAGTSHTCSAHFLLSQSFASSATLNVQVPDCALVHGTVTMSTLPAGASFVQGTVAAYLKSVSIDGGKPDSADAWSSDSVVQTAPNQFAYAMALPSGTAYSMMYAFRVHFASDGGNAPILQRIAYDTITPSGDTVHNVTADPFGAVTMANVTVGLGSNTIDPPSGALGYQATVSMTNASETLLAVGNALSPTFPVSMPIVATNETLTPFVMLNDIQTNVASAITQGGYSSQIRLDPQIASSSYSLTLPELAALSGTVSDPQSELAPAQTLNGVVVAHVRDTEVHCDSNDYGTWPNPIFFEPEFAVGYIWDNLHTHKSYLRSGITCIPYPRFYVQMGSGGNENVLGSNSYGLFETPSPETSTPITVTGDVTETYTVPTIGTQIAISGAVTDSSSQPLAGALVKVHSTALTGMPNSAFHMQVFTDGAGNFTVNLLTGVYDVEVDRPAPGYVAPVQGDAGGVDAGFSFDSGIGGGDSGSGGCSTLSTCCASSTFPAAQHATCTMIAGLGDATACSPYLSGAETAGWCP